MTVDALTASTVNGTVTSTWDTAATEVSTSASGWTATKATVDAGASNWDEAYGWGNHADAGYVTTDSNTDTTYSAGTNLNLSGVTFNLDDSITLSSVQATTQKIGSDWHAYADGSSLKFYYQGSARMVLDSNGTLTVSGNVIAYGSL